MALPPPFSFPTGFINAINNIAVGYKDFIPTYTYSGQSSISKSGTNWVLTCTSSGTLNFSALTCAVDIFIVGGGGGGATTGESKWWVGSGGGGGSVIYKSTTGNPGGSGASGIIMIRSAR